MSATQIAGLANDDMAEFTETQVAAFTSTQLNALAAKVKGERYDEAGMKSVGG